MGFLSSLRRDLKGGTKAYKDFVNQRNKWVEQQLAGLGLDIPEHSYATISGDNYLDSSIELTADQKAQLAKISPGYETGGDSGGFVVNPEYQKLQQQFEREQWAKVAAAEEESQKLQAKWLDTLPPETMKKAINEFKLHSDDLGTINKYGSMAAKGVIGISGAGALATGAGLLGGTGAAAGSGATGGVTAAEIAGSAGMPELGLATQTGLGGAGTITGGSGTILGSGLGGTGSGIGLGTGGSSLGGAASVLSKVGGSMTGVELAKLGLAGVGTLAGYLSEKDATGAAKDAASAAQRSADAAAKLGQDQLAFAIRQYDEAAPYRDQAAKTAQAVSEAQLASMKLQDDLAREYAEYNRTTFRPLEQGIVADAEGYDTPEKRNAAAESAIGDVNKQFASVNDATARRLAANGIDPASTRAMSVMQGQGMEQAKAGAGAAYAARKGVETTGFARKMDAASLGRNLPSAQATSASVGLNAGNSASGNSAAALTANNTGTQQVQNAYNSAVQANAVSGGLYNSAAQLAQRAGVISADQWGNLGNALGQWANSQGGNALLSKWFGS